jgi:tetratricopeptide (TPR) repeat protein
MKTKQASEYKNQGNTYFKEGDYENALQYYGKAVEIDPDYRDAWNNIYITLVKLDRIDDASKCKEILEKIKYKQVTPVNVLGDQPYKRLKLLLRVIVVILLALSIILATLSIFGWIGYRQVIPVAPEQYVGEIINATISSFPNIINPF